MLALGEFQSFESPCCPYLRSILIIIEQHTGVAHDHGALAKLPAVHLRLHPPSALSTMPVWQDFPLDCLLGLPEDE